MAAIANKLSDPSRELYDVAQYSREGKLANMDSTFDTAGFLDHLAQELVLNFSRAGSATTPGLVGGARETEVRRKLQSLLPEKVTVRSGCVIDSYGLTSNQTDVIVHERDNCPVFSINEAPEATYVPCESVVAFGEVKSDLGTRELRDAVVKIRSVKRLRRAVNDNTSFRRYGSALVIQGTPRQAFDPVTKSSDQPYGFVLCRSFTLATSTLAQNYADVCREAAPELAPSIVVALNDGVMMFADDSAVLRNAIGATRIVVFNHPAGSFKYLLSEIAHACHEGRTTDVLPHSRYLLGEHLGASAQFTFQLRLS